MKLFVYEHITSGALAEQPFPASLAREGDKMLTKALQDCHDTQQCSLITLRDNRLKQIPLFEQHSKHFCHHITNVANYQQSLAQCLNQCDAALIIAPETNDILSTLQQQVLDHGKILLGSEPKAIQLTTDKLMCYQHLTQSKISTITTTLASQSPIKHVDFPKGYIVKPLKGAGCLDTYFVKTASELKKHLSLNQSNLNQFIVQPYISGTNISLCLLLSNNNSEVLSINQQHLSQSQGKLTLSACTINSRDKSMPTLEEANNLAKKIKTTFPGLFGFVGIDLIANRKGLHIVDINPRLTTSYIGLRASLNLNPMQRLFDIMENNIRPLPPITQWKTIELTL